MPYGEERPVRRSREKCDPSLPWRWDIGFLLHFHNLFHLTAQQCGTEQKISNLPQEPDYGPNFFTVVHCSKEILKGLLTPQFWLRLSTEKANPPSAKSKQYLPWKHSPVAWEVGWRFISIWYMCLGVTRLKVKLPCSPWISCNTSGGGNMRHEVFSISTPMKGHLVVKFCPDWGEPERTPISPSLTLLHTLNPTNTKTLKNPVNLLKFS